MHVIDYKNWNKRKIAVFSADSAVRSNVGGVLTLLEVPTIIFQPNETNLLGRWNKYKDEIMGIMISGSKYDIGETLYPLLPPEMLNSKVPILGLCYGHELLLSILGAKPIECMPPLGEMGSTIVNLLPNPLFNGLTESRYIVNMHHNWMIDPKTLPAGVDIIAKSKNTPVSGFYHKKKDWWGVQFHPERDYMHNIIFKNFVKICYEKL